MNIKLQKSQIKNNKKLIISGSKSESNRLLLLQAFYPNIELKNLSNSDDTDLMQSALKSSSDVIDVHHAGTAMRFLTAYYATQQDREIVLTGSSRMKERPIKILVDALRVLGADIEYVNNDGFPPLRIKGKTLTENKVTLKANVSSQYISALVLIAPQLKNGLELTLKGKITSIPYINMTLSLLNKLGIETSFKDNLIQVYQQLTINSQQSLIESDWSSASYYYSIVALSDIGTSITLPSYKENSLQGDSALAEIYKTFGVETVFINNTITLRKIRDCKLQTVNCQLNNSPDIAQTIAVTTFGLGIECNLTGLHTLKIKETDRLVALKTEIEKLGGKVQITENSLHVSKSKNINSDISIETYNDHRMAMAFAPLALKTNITIKNADVVSKSYPKFWEDLKSIGFQIK